MHYKIKKLIRQVVVLAFVGVLYLGNQFLQGNDSATPEVVRDAPTTNDAGSSAGRRGGQDDAALIKQSFERQQSDVWVEAGGEVFKTLRDDLEGSRHQKFLVRLSNGHTVLIAHNIDLAPRIPLKEGDEVEFRGEFEYNDRGGVVHWTHHDPRGRKEGGWITHRSKKYE